MDLFKQLIRSIPVSVRRRIRSFVDYKLRGCNYDIEPYDRDRLSKIYNDLDKYSKSRLTKWLRFSAGSENPDYFKTRSQNGLILQQVPEEYAGYLMWLREQKIRNYLEVGVGSGSSFFINNIFMKQTVENSFAVDNTSYKCFGDQSAKISEKVELLKELNGKCLFVFVNKKSDDFFATDRLSFDLIFIDGDHQYESVKRDYNNAVSSLRTNGSVVFHDISSRGCPGVVKLWHEIKHTGKSFEFTTTDTCGIGVLKPPKQPD